jgi:hypothetical protein
MATRASKRSRAFRRLRARPEGGRGRRRILGAADVHRATVAPRRGADAGHRRTGARLARPAADHHRRVRRRAHQPADRARARLRGHEPQELQGHLQGRGQRLPARPTPRGRLARDAERRGSVQRRPRRPAAGLAAAACLGATSIERNGHHYFAGLSQFPATVQAHILAHHGDLYTRSAAGWPRLDVQQGRMRLGSVLAAPFGCAGELDLSALEQVAV